jgi:hypothetical protein
MHSIGNALQKLKREILEGLSAGPGAVPGLRLIPERVTLSISMHLRQPADGGNPDGEFVPAPAGTDGEHRVTVEFKVEPSEEGAPVLTRAESETSPRKVVSEADEALIVKSLSEVFGTPGFDSSARATVFREALENLDDPSRKAVLRDLSSEKAPSDRPEQAQARHLILRLARSGPSGEKRSREVLEQLSKKYSGEEVIRVANIHWRDQSIWASGPN